MTVLAEVVALACVAIAVACAAGLVVVAIRPRITNPTRSTP